IPNGMHCYRREVKKACLAALAAACLVPAARASGPISTGVFVPGADPLALQRIHDAGATFARINLSWAQVAPVVRPGGFEATDPADPSYRWGAVDAQVKGAVEHGLTPYVTVFDAPLWAQKDEPHPTHMGPFPITSWKPDPKLFGEFALAGARRYDGTFGALPRVRYFEAWNEANLSNYLSPQIENEKVTSPEIFRGLLNTFSAAVHSVHADNQVIASGISAFSFLTA